MRSIAQLERTLPEGGVITAHWRVTSVDGDHMASAYGFSDTQDDDIFRAAMQA